MSWTWTATAWVRGFWVTALPADPNEVKSAVALLWPHVQSTARFTHQFPLDPHTPNRAPQNLPPEPNDVKWTIIVAVLWPHVQPSTDFSNRSSQQPHALAEPLRSTCPAEPLRTSQLSPLSTIIMGPALIKCSVYHQISPPDPLRFAPPAETLRISQWSPLMSSPALIKCSVYPKISPLDPLRPPPSSKAHWCQLSSNCGSCLHHTFSLSKDFPNRSPQTLPTEPTDISSAVTVATSPPAPLTSLQAVLRWARLCFSFSP